MDECRAKKLINTRDKNYAAHKENPANKIVEEKYKKTRNCVTTLRRKLREEYYNKKFQDQAQDMRKMWQTINDAMCKKQNNLNQQTLILNHEQTEISDPTQVANIFNKYYSEAAKKLADKIETNGTDKLTRINIEHIITNSQMKWTPTSSYDIEKVIDKLKNKTSKDACGMSNKLLKMLKSYLAEPIAKITNLSFENGIFPTSLKLTKIIPIYKGGNPKEPENYRPIAIVPTISKIIETVINNQLRDYLNNISFFCPNQYGFRKNRSTEDAVTNMVTDVQEALDHGKIASGIFIDLKKAFDTVNHKLLADKLFAAGIRGKTLECIRSYLENRRQYVNINGKNSDQREQKTGVPQGSVLGPLLFIIYINDIHRCTLKGKLTLFADDTSMLYISDNLEMLFKEMQKDLVILAEWLRVNKLSLNTEKTKYMILNKDKINHNRKLHIKGKEIKETDQVTFLGLEITYNLSWEEHINKVMRKVNPIAGILKRLTRTVHTGTLKTIYYSMIHSHLQYMLPIWGCTAKKYLQKLQVMQNRAIRNLFNHSYDKHRVEMYTEAEILPLILQRDLQLTMLAYKTCHRTDTTHKALLTNEDKHNYLTRNRIQLQLKPISTTTYGSNSTAHKMKILYNQIPAELLNKGLNIKLVKNKTKTRLMLSIKDCFSNNNV